MLSAQQQNETPPVCTHGREKKNVSLCFIMTVHLIYSFGLYSAIKLCGPDRGEIGPAPAEKQDQRYL